VIMFNSLRGRVRWTLIGWMFAISALIGLAAGAIWFLLARDQPNEHPWVNPEELRHIRAGLPEQPAEPGTRSVLPWRSILGSKDVLAVTLSYSCYGYVAYIFFTWFFIYLSTVRGLDLKSSSYFGMLPFLAMATCSPLGGWISDRLTKRFGKRIGRCGIAAASMALAAVFIALGTKAADARLATIVLAGGAGASYLSTSSFWSVTADLAGTSAGTVSGVMNTGQPDRRHRDGYSDPLHCRALRLARVVPSGRVAVRGGISGMADGGSRPRTRQDTHRGLTPPSARDTVPSSSICRGCAVYPLEDGASILSRVGEGQAL
jgi:nitrate/nitrite transporter NarK